jgi:hypothetical protein
MSPRGLSMIFDKDALAGDLDEGDSPSRRISDRPHGTVGAFGD